MENIKSCELCLKQIIKTEDFENLHCDEKQNLRILKNLEINVRKDARICSNCVNTSHLTYNFKMSCLTNNDHLKTLIDPGISDKLILEEVVVEETKSEFKSEKKVCRFCLNFSEVNSLVEVNLEQDVVLKDMLRRCLPEIDTNIVQNPLICSICSKLLEKLFTFFSQCEDTEVFRNLDKKPDVFVNENMPTVENNDFNIDKSFVKEENCDGIENSQLQIKSEDFDMDEDIKDSINDSNSVEEKDVKPKPHGTIEEKKFVCDICSYQTTRLFHLEQHHLTHKESSEVNVFKCNYCPFSTKWKKNLISHAIRHKNPSELRKFKCDYCPFTTANKNSLIEHSIRHKNPSELPKFKCNDCPYETYIKRYLTGHALVHKSPSQINMYKCKACPFQTKHKRYIRIHKKQHQVEIYTCDKCNYKSKFKCSFMLHLRNHKEWKQPAKSSQNLKEVRQYKCNECSYVGTRNWHLIQHQKLHKDPSEREMYNCMECPFQTLYKSTLKKHHKKNHSNLEIPFGKLKAFRCKESDYKSTDRKSILEYLQAQEQKLITLSVKEELQEQDNTKDNEGT